MKGKKKVKLGAYHRHYYFGGRRRKKNFASVRWKRITTFE